jgi:hypothetical protein
LLSCLNRLVARRFLTSIVTNSLFGKRCARLDFCARSGGILAAKSDKRTLRNVTPPPFFEHQWLLLGHACGDPRTQRIKAPLAAGAALVNMPVRASDYVCWSGDCSRAVVSRCLKRVYELFRKSALASGS